MARDLRIAVKREYFEAIKSGEKIDEFRLVNDYWKKRLFDKDYDTVTITLGYPKKGDKDREITSRYIGFTVECIQHKEWGYAEAVVFAIPVGMHPAIKERDSREWRDFI